MSTPVTLQKLGASRRKIIGKLLKMPRRNDNVIVEYDDGQYEYITTKVVRILQMVNDGVFYFETTNSRYKLRVGT